MSDGGVDPRAVLAAGNNADLYQIMFAAHGIPFERYPFAFVGQDRPLPYYSDITVLRPGHIPDLEAEMRGVLARSGGLLGIKDSFCQLELGGQGFKKLFDANWLWRDAQVSEMPSGWRVLSTVEELHTWEETWKETGSATPRRMFPATLLAQEAMVFLGKWEGDILTAGCIVNLSDTCAGLSNVFARRPTAPAFAEAAEAASAVSTELPLVGYEHGAPLDHALACGFVTTGPLRILFAQNAQI